jgi:hypothetical protein
MKGRGYETCSRNRIFSIYLIFLAAFDSRVYSAPNTTQYQREKQMLGGSRVLPVREADNLTVT